jgi:RNA polymerase sigma factor (sigma-70 family)
MNGGRIEAGRQLERLFGVGTVGGLSDVELLARFAAVDDEAAGAAFEAIVARHGPMVLRVCRMILRDAHAAEDAFQATFLVLARRARTLGERELLGNWLYGVAMRTARKARIAAARRIAREQRAAAGRRSVVVVEPEPHESADELVRVLHEEIGRLPGSYRSAVVACYLEGLTQEQAARQLRLTEGRVRGRLARARKLLGHRLTRRGVAPAIGLAALQDAAGSGRLPEAIVRSVARDALHFARSAGPATCGVVPSTARALADGVLSTMWLPSLKSIAMAASLVAAGIGLTAAAAAALGRRPAEAEVVPAPGPVLAPDPAPAPAPSPAPDPKPAAEPASSSPQDSGERRPKTAKTGQRYAPHVAIDQDLAKRAPGAIVRGVPVTKDCMILAYLPDQNVGHVDNFGLANNHGGVRVVIDWPGLPADEASVPDHRFILALYSRRTTSHPPAGRIHALELLEDWRELTSWSHMPRHDPEPFATYQFEPGEGWKLFDITPMVREQAKAHRTGHGVLLRFFSEDFSGTSWSGYDLVSREGAGEWAGRHPVLLIVKDAKAEKPGTK